MWVDSKFGIITAFLIQVEIISLADASDRRHCPDVVQRSRYHVATHNRTCYLFVNKEVYWEDARKDCWRMGGEMLVIPNEQTMNFMKTELGSRKLHWTNNGVWNGANDLRRRGWEWTTGEKLTYTYWDSGEPSSLLGLGIFSAENCACMRRNDGWRWHDYPCDMIGYKYKYICQFGFMQYRPTDTDSHQQGPGTRIETRDDLLTVVGLAIGGLVLLVLMCSITYCLYRKHEHQKATAERPASVRFQNAGYATIMQDVSRNNDNANPRPTSNVYFDPTEVTRIYDEVNKQTNHGINFLETTESAPIRYVGGATNLDDVDGGYVSNIPSEVSTGSSGFCSGATEPKRSNESEYVEMSGGASLNSVVEYENGNACANGSNVSTSPIKDKTSATENGDVNDLKPAKENGDINSLKPLKPGAEGHDAPANNRQSNIYVVPTAVACVTELKQQNDTVSDTVTLDNMEVEGEMHLYTNSLDLLESQKGRPLPPIPGTDYEVPLSGVEAV